LLRRAARAGEVSSAERDRLITHAVPNLGREEVLLKLREALDAWQVGYRDRAELIINELIEKDRKIELEKGKT
jgi:hypothetical protein